MTTVVEIVANYREAAAGAKPPGSGWKPVGKSKHGGYRRPKDSGGYEYWYPSKDHARKAAKHHYKQSRKHVDHANFLNSSGKGDEADKYYDKSSEHMDHHRGARAFARGEVSKPSWHEHLPRRVTKKHVDKLATKLRKLNRSKVLDHDTTRGVLGDLDLYDGYDDAREVYSGRGSHLDKHPQVRNTIKKHLKKQHG